MITGKGSFDAACAFGLTCTTFVIDGLTAAMGMQVKVDPAACRGPRIFGHTSRFYRHLDLCGGPGLEGECYFVPPDALSLLRVGRDDKQAEDGVENA